MLLIKIVFCFIKESDVESIVAKTIQHFGHLDVLVNIAGAARVGSIETATLDGFDFSINTNLRSVFHLTSLAVPHLLHTKGNVVNVSSVGGIRSFTDLLPYCVSKAALDQFTKCVALELAPKGVRVNSVNPAAIEPNKYSKIQMDDELYATYMESIKATHPIGRIGTSSEVAHAIAYLADNNAASFVTGTLLAVDGCKANLCPR